MNGSRMLDRYRFPHSAHLSRLGLDISLKICRRAATDIDTSIRVELVARTLSGKEA